MDDERAGYAEDFGLLFEGFGLPRMVGRVLGVLLISGGSEFSAEDLAEALQASRGVDQLRDPDAGGDGFGAAANQTW